MTDLAQKIEDLAAGVTFGDRHTALYKEIKSAIYAGIEEALKMEPSEGVIYAGHVHCRRGPEFSLDSAEKCFLAMRAAQWKEIEEGRK
jgi:hypothetical protein